MSAIADDENLYLLKFADEKGLDIEIEKLLHSQKATLAQGYTKPLNMIKNELNLYFAGKSDSFKTPLSLIGSNFQICAWQALQHIPYGQTRSYKKQAEITGNEKAFRAVANANGRNKLAIVIPCHRVVNHNGAIGGYSGGIKRKEWLIQHEKKNATFKHHNLQA